MTGDRVPRDPLGDPTGRRWWRRRKAIADRSLRFGANPDTAWSRADAVFSIDGYWQKTCSVCGAAFEAKRSDAVTCSDRCRARRARKQKPPTTRKSDYL